MGYSKFALRLNNSSFTSETSLSAPNVAHLARNALNVSFFILLAANLRKCQVLREGKSVNSRDLEQEERRGMKEKKK